MLRWTLLGGGVVACGYLLGGVLLRPDMSVGYRLLSCGMDLVAFGWLFFMGAAIGSFLNVVAWRVPRGKSVGGRSHCPYCTQAIEARDNIPVFGWIFLRGRCRACRLPISARYPIVELAVGLSLAPVGMAVLLRGQAYRPLESLPHVHHWPLSFGELGYSEMLAGVYLYAAVAGLWAMALVRLDGHRLPIKLIATVGAMTLTPLLVFPFLQPMPWQLGIPTQVVEMRSLDFDGTSATWPGASVSPIRALANSQASVVWRGTLPTDALMFLLCAAATGVFLSRLAGRFLFAQADFKSDPLGQQTHQLLDWAVALSLCGVVIGWQGLVGIFPLALIVAGVLRRYLRTFDRAGVCMLALLPLLTLVIVLWPWLARQTWWPAAGNSGMVYLAYGFAGWVVAGLLAVFVFSTPRPSQKGETSSDFVADSNVQEFAGDSESAEKAPSR